jgi:hypothetical protein
MNREIGQGYRYSCRSMSMLRQGALSIFGFEELAQNALFDKSHCLVNRQSAMVLAFDI